MQDPTFKDNDFLLTSDAARELNVSGPTVLLWHRTGRLSAIRTSNGTRLFRRSDVERLKRERAEQEHAEATA